MKVTLDLSRLVEENKITLAERDRLAALAAHDTGALGINILIGFAVVAVAGGAVALVPTPFTAIALGAVLFALGLALGFARAEQWAILAQVCVVLGALMFCGGVLAQGKGALAAMLIVTAALAAGAVIARSGLLIAAAVLALGACFGARAGYWHATYALAIYEPLVTVVVFSLLALAAYRLSRRFPADYERLSLIAARTAVFMVNFGFWVGSLWGDSLLLLRSLWHNDSTILTDYTARSLIIPAWAFSLAWAAALIAVGAWGGTANRRWVVNVAAVFGAIHFYTQWFEKLGASPATVLVGGILLLAFALGLWRFNKDRAASA
jgi:iron complex transport system permease protein